MKAYRTHHLKILPRFFNQIIKNEKTAELRKNDRNYQVGDSLVLKEWRGKYTGKKSPIYVITAITVVDAWVPKAENGWVILHLGGVVT